jgi:hypothetical protein
MKDVGGNRSEESNPRFDPSTIEQNDETYEDGPDEEGNRHEDETEFFTEDLVESVTEEIEGAVEAYFIERSIEKIDDFENENSIEKNVKSYLSDIANSLIDLAENVAENNYLDFEDLSLQNTDKSINSKLELIDYLVSKIETRICDKKELEEKIVDYFSFDAEELLADSGKGLDDMNNKELRNFFPREVTIKIDGESRTLDFIGNLKTGGQKNVVEYQDKAKNKFAVAFAKKGGKEIIEREKSFLKMLNEQHQELKVPEVYDLEDIDLNGSCGESAFVMENIEKNTDQESSPVTREEFNQHIDTAVEFHENDLYHQDLTSDQFVSGHLTDFDLSLSSEDFENFEQRRKEIYASIISGKSRTSAPPATTLGFKEKFRQKGNETYKKIISGGGYEDGKDSFSISELEKMAEKNDVRSYIKDVLEDKIHQHSSSSELEIQPYFGISSNIIESFISDEETDIEQEDLLEIERINIDNLSQRKQSFLETSEDVEIDSTTKEAKIVTGLKEDVVQRAQKRMFALLNQLDTIQLPPSILASLFSSGNLEKTDSICPDMETARSGPDNSESDNLKNENMGAEEWFYDYLEDNPEAAELFYKLNELITINSDVFLEVVGGEDLENGNIFEEFFEQAKKSSIRAQPIIIKISKMLGTENKNFVLPDDSDGKFTTSELDDVGDEIFNKFNQ